MEQTFRTSPHCTRANESLLFPGQPCYTILKYFWWPEQWLVKESSALVIQMANCHYKFIHYISLHHNSNSRFIVMRLLCNEFGLEEKCKL